MKPETMKVATDEAVPMTTKEDLIEELRLKKDQLKDKRARLDGGFSPILRRDYMPIDKEIERIEKIIRMRTIEIQYDVPLQPKYAHEQNDEWRGLRKGFLTEEMDDMKKGLDNLKTQREKIFEEIKQLELRTQVIKKVLEETNIPSEKPIKPVKEEVTEEPKEVVEEPQEEQ